MRYVLITVAILAFIIGSVAYSEVLPSESYELTKEERSKLSSLLINAGHTQEIANVAADKYKKGNTIINVKLKPVSKHDYKEMTCLYVDYENSQMKISGTSRMVCDDSTEFYFSVGPNVADTVIDKAVAKYLSIMKYKEFGFIKLGNIRCLYQKGDFYVLSVIIPEDPRYAFTLLLDKKNPDNITKIEIEPLPML